MVTVAPGLLGVLLSWGCGGTAERLLRSRGWPPGADVCLTAALRCLIISACGRWQQPAAGVSEH